MDDPDPAERRRKLLRFLRFYLSEQHCEAPADGCLIPALSSDVARASDAIRATYDRRVVAVIAKAIPAMPGPPEAQAEHAWAVMATIVGAMTIARALPPGDHRRTILDAAHRAAVDIIDRDEVPTT